MKPGRHRRRAHCAAGFAPHLDGFAQAHLAARRRERADENCVSMLREEHDRHSQT